MFRKVCLGAVLIFVAIPFARLDFVEELIQAENVPSEKHTVRTSDGYLLQVYRIPNTNSTKKNGKVVLLMHSLVCSASCFLMLGINSGAFYLANAGYDVWLGNNRGTRFAREHETMSPDDPKFWDFSWHELGVLDLPATIDFILDKTNVTKLSYVGHSQSVTILYVMLAELPEYNEKITVAHAMTPTVLFKQTDITPVTLFNSMDTVNGVQDMVTSSGMYEVVPYAPPYTLIMRLLTKMCQTQIGKMLCHFAISYSNGSSKHIHNNLFEILSKHMPAGASYKQIIHNFQNGVSHEFQKFDYGKEKNMEIYGTPKLPLYNLANVQANIHMMYGTDDKSTPAINIRPLSEAMGRKIAIISKFKGFGHSDFKFAEQDKVYGKILKIDEQFN